MAFSCSRLCHHHTSPPPARKKRAMPTPSKMPMVALSTLFGIPAEGAGVTGACVGRGIGSIEGAGEGWRVSSTVVIEAASTDAPALDATADAYPGEATTAATCAAKLVGLVADVAESC